MHITIAGLLPNHSPVPAWIAAIPTFLPAPGPKLALTAIAHAIHHSSALCSTQKASTQPNRAERSYRTWHQAYLPHTTCISLKYPYGEAKSLPTPPTCPGDLSYLLKQELQALRLTRIARELTAGCCSFISSHCPSSCPFLSHISPGSTNFHTVRKVGAFYLTLCHQP